MQKEIYNTKGKKEGEIKLPDSVFGIDWNADLMHEVVTSYFANARPNLAKTKDRSEVRGADTKPWRQKGTGRARHGSIYSPIWRGGGVTHGPVANRTFKKKINKKVKNKALAIALSHKLEEQEMLFVNDLSLKEPKTKEARSILLNLSGVTGFDGLLSKKKNATLIIVPKKDIAVQKSFGNFKNIAVKEARDITAVDVMRYKYSVMVQPQDVVEVLAGRIVQASKEKTKA